MINMGNVSVRGHTQSLVACSMKVQRVKALEILCYDVRGTERIDIQGSRIQTSSLVLFAENDNKRLGMRQHVSFCDYLARFGSSLLAQRRGKPFNLLRYPLIKVRRGTTHLVERRQAGRQRREGEGEDRGRRSEGEQR